MTNMREASLKNYGLNRDIPNDKEINMGSLQRIADATERMARRHTELIGENEDLGARLNYWIERCKRVERSNSALRGVITRLRRRLSA